VAPAAIGTTKHNKAALGPAKIHVRSDALRGSCALISNVPVIYLTARSDEVDRTVGLELGAVDYEPKPFSPREIASRVRAIPRRTREPEPAEPTMEPLFRVDFGVLKRMYVGPHDRGQNLKLTA
jgi:DNA-binding response OmpR family regulator